MLASRRAALGQEAAIYASVKQALGHAAATHARCGRVRRTGIASTNRDEWAAVAVFACLARIGVDPHGEVALELLRWATSPSDAQSESDLEAELADDPLERRRVSLWSRVAQAKRDLADELARHGLLSAPPPLPPAAYRVGRQLGRVRVFRLAAPDPSDPGVVEASSREEAIEVAARRGVIADLEDATITASARARLRREVTAAAKSTRPRELDNRIMGELGITRQAARRLRRTWLHSHQ